MKHRNITINLRQRAPSKVQISLIIRPRTRYIEFSLETNNTENFVEVKENTV